MNKPVILDFKIQSMEETKKRYRINHFLDTYKDQLEDLFLVRNPRFRFNKNYKNELGEFVTEQIGEQPIENAGKWVYFPWSQDLVHYLNDEELQEIRTARNKNFILDDEQEKFYNFSVGVAGLSVGSHGIITIALMGGARKIKLADPDILSPTNLNRLRFDFTSIGQNKAELVAQYIYQLNPYSDIDVYSEGINGENIQGFVNGLDVIIEELDDIEIKVRMREQAKKRKIPVVMATDNGDNVIMDIERFDLNPDLEVFYGKLKGLDLKEIKKEPQKMYEAMARIIDISLVPPRVLHSINAVGKTIYSWPQIASAATLSGAVLAYVVRKIALGESMVSGKSEVNLDSVFDPLYGQNRNERIKEAEKFLQAINSSPSNK